ncbi:MAG TPA: hypothetical protein VFI61_04545, partial [Patescibacteria group bacterium]|nr:hypothetical protein [Patescibacteria group bacterium]
MPNILYTHYAMKFLGKSILVFLLVPIIVLFVLSLTIKFELLQANFWKNTLKKNNVYANLSVKLKSLAENQSKKGGGKATDLSTITDIITPNIVEDFITRNLDNFFSFANGKQKILMVYLPINKIPKEFAPKSVGLNSEELPLTSLLSKFNIMVGQDLPISQIAYAGVASSYLFFGLLALSILLIYLLFIFTE